MKFSNDIWNELRASYEARHEPEQLRSLVELYWKSLLMLSVACVFGALALGVWQFVSVVEAISSVQNGSPTSNPTVLDRSKLGAVLHLYDTRVATYTEITVNPKPVPDPSK